MKVLGIEIAGSDTRLVILDGTSKAATIRIPSPSKLPLPPDNEQVNRLRALQSQIHNQLVSDQIDRVAVIRADAGCSPIRAKIECVVQYAAADLSLPCKLVAPQTVATVSKRKLNEVADSQLCLAFEQLTPAYLKKAAYCAWSVMNDGS